MVNYDYLTQLLENYGFILLRREELKDAALAESTGLFTDIFQRMNNDIKRNPRLANEFKYAPQMTAGERQISFLNRYFIYKKVRKVDTENVFLGLTNKTAAQAQDEADATQHAQEEVLATAKAQAQAPAPALKVKGKTKKVLKLTAALPNA